MNHSVQLEVLKKETRQSKLDNLTLLYELINSSIRQTKLLNDVHNPTK